MDLSNAVICSSGLREAQPVPCTILQIVMAFGFSRNIEVPGWRDNPTVKRGYGSSKGPKFSSQQPCWTAHNSRRIKSFKPLKAPALTCTYPHIDTPIHIIKTKIYIFKRRNTENVKVLIRFLNNCMLGKRQNEAIACHQVSDGKTSPVPGFRAHAHLYAGLLFKWLS